jgi:hypothetical protein
MSQEKDMHTLTSPFHSCFYVICYNANEEFGLTGTEVQTTLNYLDTIELIVLSLEHNSYVIYLQWIVSVKQVSACSKVNRRTKIQPPT